MRSKATLGAAAFLVGGLIATSALAQTCTGPMRKINIGVAVAPPNVVHTAPYVAKALGEQDPGGVAVGEQARAGMTQFTQGVQSLLRQGSEQQ